MTIDGDGGRRDLGSPMTRPTGVIALVTARAGSKGVPGKNIRPLGGKPLIAWSIEAALQTPEIDRVVVSTDGEEVAEAAQAAGAEVLWRPARLADDQALSADVVRHAISELTATGAAAGHMALLQPTSPLRRASDISRCLHLLDQGGYDTVATFCQAATNPHRAWTIQNGVAGPFIQGADAWAPRQFLPPAWELNGAVYVFPTTGFPSTGPNVLFGRIGAIEMELDRSIDIDTEADFREAEAILLASGASSRTAPRRASASAPR